MMTIKDVYTKIVNLITPPPLPLPPAGLFCAWKLDGGGGLKLCLILMTCINRQYIA